MTEKYKEEYLDVCANMRHYANMRFAQLTLYLAITGTILAATLVHDQQIYSSKELFFSIMGLITTGIFFIMEESAADYWHDFKNRAIELEQELGYNQHTGTRTRKVLSATNMVRLLYSSMIAFWAAIGLGINNHML